MSVITKLAVSLTWPKNSRQRRVPRNDSLLQQANRKKECCAAHGAKIAVDHQLFAEHDAVILATGVKPRVPTIEGIEHKSVLTYLDVLKHNVEVGSRVAILGAGGIGFDVAEFLLHDPTEEASSQNITSFAKEWGFDPTIQVRGGVAGIKPQARAPKRELFLMQRTRGKLGQRLGKTTGWIHRAALKRGEVKMFDGISYDKIDDQGLHYTRAGKSDCLSVDHIIVCAGQLPLRDLNKTITEPGKEIHLVGGALEARELDAKLAIEAGAKLAMNI